MALDIRPPTVKWRRLRRKDDTGTDDPDWLGLGLNPNSFILTVGGTASDGAYTVNIVPLNPKTYPPAQAEVQTAIANTFTRGAGEANAAITTAINALLQTDIASGGTLDAYIKATTVVSSTTIECEIEDNAPPFIVTTSAPGTGTLVVTPDDVFPCAKPFPHTRGDERDVTALDLMFVVVDSNNDVLTTEGTFSLEGVQAIKRETHTRPDLDQYAVGGSVELTSQNVNIIQRFNVNGADIFGVRMSSIASLNGSADAIEVWFKEADV